MSSPINKERVTVSHRMTLEDTKNELRIPRKLRIKAGT